MTVINSVGEIKETKLDNVQSGNTWFQDILEHITTVSHVLLICVTVFSLYLCCQEEKFTLLTWHVFLYLLGWTFIATEGTMLIARENIIGKRLATKWRTHTHWVTFFIAMGLTIGGFSTIVYNKRERTHFTSDHGLAGLVSLILACMACCNGIPALFSTRLRSYVSPNLNKLFHALVGIAAVISGLWATVTGYYIKWFSSKVTENQLELIVGITIACTVWALLKPALNCLIRAKNVFTSCGD